MRIIAFSACLSASGHDFSDGQDICAWCGAGGIVVKSGGRMIDTTNKFTVAAVGDRLTVLAPGLDKLARGITHDEAINLAAWLVAMAYNAEADFEDTLAAVKDT